MGSHRTDDVIGHTLFAKPIACAPPIALQGFSEGCIEPDGYAEYMQLMREIDRVCAIAALIVRGVEDDGSIGLQLRATSANTASPSCGSSPCACNSARTSSDPTMTALTRSPLACAQWLLPEPGKPMRT